MAALTNLVPGLLNRLSFGLVGSPPLQTSIRTIIRVHFPRAKERKRTVVHGWKKRMSTPEGRRVLMNRILKGHHVYSH